MIMVPASKPSFTKGVQLHVTITSNQPWIRCISCVHHDCNQQGFVPSSPSCRMPPSKLQKSGVHPCNSLQLERFFLQPRLSTLQPLVSTTFFSTAIITPPEVDCFYCPLVWCCVHPPLQFCNRPSPPCSTPDPHFPFLIGAQCPQ